MPNILEYIEELMDSGMSEEDASRCANVMYRDDGWDDDEEYDDYNAWCERMNEEFGEE